MYFKIIRNNEIVGFERDDIACYTISLEYKRNIKDVREQLASMKLNDSITFEKDIWKRIL